MDTATIELNKRNLKLLHNTESMIASLRQLGHVAAFEFRKLPRWMQFEIWGHVMHGLPASTAFHAILSNNLIGMANAFDAEDMKHLKNVITVLYNTAPAKCWGTEEKVLDWQKRGGAFRVLRIGQTVNPSVA